MKKLSLPCFPLAFVFALFLTCASLSLQADPLGNNSRSNATSVLNDTFSPGLPHLAILKNKNNVLGFFTRENGTQKVSGFKGLTSILNSEYAKQTIQGGGFDANYLVAGDWGLNLNGGYSRAVIEPNADKKQRERTDQTYAAVNFAGHYQGTFLYGFALGKDIYDDSDRNAKHEDTKKRKHDYTPITASVGLHMNGFFAGLGVTQFQDNEKYTNQDDPSQNWKVSGSITAPKLGVGWNSSNRAENFYQVSYSFASLPKRKFEGGGYYKGETQKHDFAFEFQKQNFQTGFYLMNSSVAKTKTSWEEKRARVDLAFSYAPFVGNLISLIVAFDELNQMLPEKSAEGDDWGKPILSTYSTGITLSYGWAFF